MRTRIQLLDLVDKTGAAADLYIATDGDGNFVLLAPPGGGGSGIGIYGLDEGVPLGTGTWIDFVGAGVDATISGTVLTIDIPGGGVGGAGLGIYGIDDGIPLGTGTWLDFGDDLIGSISGTVLRVDRAIPGTGTVVLYDEVTILGSIENLVVEGDPAYASQTGAFGYLSFSGSVGPQGPEGATGSVGPQGAEGATGSAGPQGPEGATGSVGPQGAEGATGSQGAEGAEGPQGPEGATGSVGPQGAEGATGSVGPQGSEGATGSVGSQGPEGATGSVGPQGPEGATGSQGPQGIEGATGATGPQGPPGGGGGGQLGVFGLDDGVPLGTGTWIDWGDNLDASLSGTVLRVDGIRDPKVTIFTVEGDVVVSTGTLRMYNRWDRAISITNVFTAVATAPSDDSMIVDVNLDGTTIFTTQSRRPTIASGTFADTSEAPDVQTWGTGSYLTMEVDQIGSPTAGANLVVHVVGV